MRLYEIINIFQKELHKDNFKELFNNNEKLISEITYWRDYKETLTWFLCAFPLSKSKEKIYDKLNNNEKWGLLSRHIMSIASKRGCSDYILSEFNLVKEKFKDYNKSLKEESYKYDIFGDLLDRSSTKNLMDIYREQIRLETLKNEYNNRLVEMTMYLVEFSLKTYNVRIEKIKKIIND